MRFKDIQDDVAASFRPVALQKRLEFEIELDPELPGSFETDSKRIQPILRNLLSNAFKFTSEGKVQLHTVEAGKGARSNVDYGTVAPAMRSTCATDYAILTQYDRYEAERTAFPDQYAAYRELLARGQLVATFSPQYGKVGGPVVRIIRFPRRGV